MTTSIMGLCMRYGVPFFEDSGRDFLAMIEPMIANPHSSLEDKTGRCYEFLSAIFGLPTQAKFLQDVKYGYLHVDKF